MTATRPLPIVALLALATAACRTPPIVVDPTVVLETRGGRELGVSTDYGVVFLGHTAQAGEVDVAVWFGDGPSLEPSVIEPVGGGIFTAGTEIRLPSVALSFEDPEAGTEVWIQGRDVQGRWRIKGRVARRPEVDGLLLAVPAELALPNDQTGAAVLVFDDADRLRLLGLVSGRIRLETAEGTGQFLTVVGPDSLWRLVSFRRDPHLDPPLPYRDDVR
jgi:hypothetical protein